MANKTSFSPEEWATLTESVHLSALAVTVAGASGLFGTLAEAMGTGASLVEGMKSENELIRSLCAQEELQAAQQRLREHLKGLQGGDLKTAQERLKSLAVERVRAAVEILMHKGDATDLAKYRAFIKGVGEKVANAAKEGGFLGFGGERVSEGERRMLAELENALGALRA